TATATLTLNGVEPTPIQRNLDVELVLDESGSVTAPSFATMKNEASSFSQQLLGGTNALGLTTFSSSARTIFSLTTARASAANAIAGLYELGGNTNIGAGLQRAYNDFLSHGRPQSQRVIILETDGLNNMSTSQLPSIVSSIQNSGVLIFTVGIGTQVDATQLRSIASSIAGVQTTFLAGTYTGLASVLTSIAGSVEVPAAKNLTYVATPAAGFTVTGVTATRGTAAVSAAGGVSWSLAQLGNQSATITYTLKQTTTADGTFPVQTGSLLSWIDPAGSVQSAAFDGATTSVGGCNKPPIANAGNDQTVSLVGSHTANVALDGTNSSDDGLTAPLTYTWSENGATIDTGATPIVPLGLGQHALTLTVFDGEYSSSDTVTVTVVDPTPPEITPLVAGPTGNGGWYTGDTTVSWSVGDAESDISGSVGCDQTTIVDDTTGADLTCQASSAGGPSSQSVTVKRDATPPTVTYTGGKATYALDETIAITCAAADATSGLASSTCHDLSAPAWTMPGTTTLSATAQDNAGNDGAGTATFTVRVTAAGICGLAGNWVTDNGVANSLCIKVQHGSITAFDNEVRAHTRKRLTQAQANALVTLAARL
ncbi:MAG: hypothetical protein QOI27_350, partial [Gaiellaceae bacterium]|nr:hypothetical protein [Gaiellaceae bacterium]